MATHTHNGLPRCPETTYKNRLVTRICHSVGLGQILSEKGKWKGVPPFQHKMQTIGDDANHQQIQPPTTKTPSHSKCIWLPMKFLQSDGGQFSSDYKAENVLKPDSSVYCTNRSRNIRIVVKLDQLRCNSDHFVLTHILVKAPESGFTSPVGTGHVYIHSSMDNLQYSPEMLCASFNLQENQYFTCVKLPVPRWGKFVTIHLLEPRRGSEGDNIDIQYVGFKGFIGPHAFARGQLL